MKKITLLLITFLLSGCMYATQFPFNSPAPAGYGEVRTSRNIAGKPDPAIIRVRSHSELLTIQMWRGPNIGRPPLVLEPQTDVGFRLSDKDKPFHGCYLFTIVGIEMTSAGPNKWGPVQVEWCLYRSNQTREIWFGDSDFFGCGYGGWGYWNRGSNGIYPASGTGYYQGYWSEGYYSKRVLSCGK